MYFSPSHEVNVCACLMNHGWVPTARRAKNRLRLLKSELFAGTTQIIATPSPSDLEFSKGLSALTIEAWSMAAGVELG